MTISDGNSPLRIAIIGSGPAGVFAADALTTQQHVSVSVDVFDKLCTPFGLVRYGVAPDHQKIKAVSATFLRILQRPQVRFLGRVEFGRDLMRDEILTYYDAVIYAVGASQARDLAIPGELLPGSISATDFVAWYNGHPDWATRTMPPPPAGVAVIGLGNVAVDVARVLAKTVDELASTDMPTYVLDTLAQSRVTDIYVLGRHGPAHAKFSTQELKELGELAAADVIVRPEDLPEISSEDSASVDPAIRRNLEVLREFASRGRTGRPRRIHLRFLTSPIEVTGRERVEGLRIERNRIDAHGAVEGTGELETLDVQMVLRAVGYKGQALAGVPFDERLGIIPNDRGRVLRDGTRQPGEYVTGWIKNGPIGVIGTNKACAAETVACLLEDASSLARAPQQDPDRLAILLRARQVPYTTLEQWLMLDQYEQAVGRANGRPRTKVYSREVIVRLASEVTAVSATA
jgi:ferredoxin--NADP+ reductase